MSEMLERKTTPSIYILSGEKHLMTMPLYLVIMTLCYSRMEGGQERHFMPPGLKHQVGLNALP